MRKYEHNLYVRGIYIYVGLIRLPFEDLTICANGPSSRVFQLYCCELLEFFSA